MQPNAISTINVFVYGTLKRDFRNHGIASPYVLDVRCGSVDGFELWHETSFPYAVRAPGHRVYGEVLRLDNTHGTALARLDRLEGVPVHYERAEVSVNIGNNMKLTCFMYVYPRGPESHWCKVGTEWRDDHFGECALAHSDFVGR